eukprot:g10624.t1
MALVKRDIPTRQYDIVNADMQRVDRIDGTIGTGILCSTSSGRRWRIDKLVGSHNIGKGEGILPLPLVEQEEGGGMGLPGPGIGGESAGEDKETSPVEAADVAEPPGAEAAIGVGVGGSVDHEKVSPVEAANEVEPPGAEAAFGVGVRGSVDDEEASPVEAVAVPESPGAGAAGAAEAAEPPPVVPSLVQRNRQEARRQPPPPMTMRLRSASNLEADAAAAEAEGGAAGTSDHGLIPNFFGAVNGFDEVEAKNPSYTAMRAARGVTLGFQVLVVVSAATSAIAETDGIPEVGIGAVHPICDPLQEECISSDEQVQDDIIAGLQADDKVTGTSNVIELGELLCDSVDEASSSTVLRFAISSEEIVTAKRTSYSKFNGSAFSDGKQRKIWKGLVVDPAPASGAAPRTISMTWTSPCETETFVLKTTARNLDDTMSVTTSVPCAAGSSTEICMVQYDVDLPGPMEPAETTKDSTRRLTLHRSTSEKHTDETVRESAALTSRNLQSTVQIDVMFLYDKAAMEGGVAVTSEQMETLIADELPYSNEAAANSLINLQFNLVHTGKLPYTVQTQEDNAELYNFKENADVKVLRDQYQADLVVMVGVFPDVCGRAYINPNTQASDESWGYGLIDVHCFDGRTTSHEIGHNMGADHDRVNRARSVTEYGHGLRVCADDANVRFRTLMAYPCSYSTQSDEDSGWAEWINYFSNPDVDFLGVPTGTSGEDNAQILRDNMVAVSNFRVGSGGLSCTPGVEGILDNDVCCPASCGACGGSGCGGRNGGDGFTGNEACCAGGVRGLNRVCSASVGAPCIVSDDPPAPTPAPVSDGGLCAAGIPGILANDVCCPNSCGACGGSGCSGRDGGDIFSGGEACCKGGVEKLDRICSSTVGAPCIVSDEPPPPTPAPVTEEQMCSAGIPGILANDICCPNSCRSCGGVGCSRRDGGGSFTGKEACCGGGVKELGRICSSTVGAPCIVSDDLTCVAGVPGILANDVCCPNSCGSCGGVGCSRRDGGGSFTGKEACCRGGVKTLDRICSSTVGAPCIVSDDPPAPTPAPVTEEEEEMCSAGIPGILANDVCCPNSCGACGGVGCGRRDGGDDFTGSQACCGGGVRGLNRVCSASVGAPCVVSETKEETCATGVPGILVSDVCCPSSCGACGGSGCSKRDGGDFSGSQACCGSGVRRLGRVCSPSVGAPCVVGEDIEDSSSDDVFTCDGVKKGDYCCSDGCGECGGSGCSNRGGGLTGDDCCTKNILASGRVCSATRAAPCFFD